MSTAAVKVTSDTDPEPARVAEIAATLSASPFAMGASIDNRAAWASVANNPALVNIVADAEKKLNEPVPAMTAEVYGLFNKTGERKKEYFDVRYNRHERIALYTLAECIENKGRFVEPLEAMIANVCAEPTWLFNFHDGKLDAWNGKSLWIDLGAILPASDMSQALVLLGDRLSAYTRKRIVDICRQRILDPYRQMIATSPNSWAFSEMNWNAVCHAGVVTTALATVADPVERAYYIAMAEKLSVNYLRGFGRDGYCSEGMGYWTYGFGNFSQLAELILQATRGHVNLFDLPGAKLAALYPTRLQIMNGLAPSYSDCELDPHPDANLSNLLNGHYGLGMPVRPPADVQVRLLPTLAYVFPNSVTMTTVQRSTASVHEMRDYFDQGGVLVCRPTLGSTGRMGVALKGGHNAEEHNHNDLGTFVVAVGRHLPILDPGLEVYSARTFNSDRYQSKLINSYGHPVPVVAGKLQKVGRDARAEVLRADFSDEWDVFAMQLNRAYEVTELQTLTRTFTYDRRGRCSLAVADEVAFSSPQTFASALITYGQWKLTGADKLTITEEGDGVDIRIDGHGQALDILAEVVDEQTPSGAKPTRVEIRFKRPVERAKLTLFVTPLDS